MRVFAKRKHDEQKRIRKAMESDGESKQRTLGPVAGKWVLLIGLAMSVFHVLAASPWVMFKPMWQSACHIAFVAAIGFLVYPFNKKAAKSPRAYAVDITLTVLFTAALAYIIFFYQDIQSRPARPTALDVTVGLVFLLCVFEMARRTMGLALPIITLVFILYAFLGPYMPKALRHGGFDFDYFIQYITLTTEGIFGSPIATTSKYVFLYMLFGSLVVASGCGRFIMDIACAVAGKSRGGPAKMAVISSAAFGSISGSAVANVVTTGSFTIPMMKRLGYPDYYAGAVEAVASTGGVLMPPIMGAAAFIMAEMIGVSYFSVVKAAIIPAILFYGAVLTMVHLRACKEDIKGLETSEIPSLKETIKRDGHLILPIVILIVLIAVFKLSAMLCAFISIFVVIVIAACRKHTRMSPKTIVKACESAARSAVTLIPGVALAGIISGCVTGTGLAGRISSLITAVAGNNMLLMLIMTMVTCLILGMGVTAAVAYLIPAVLVVPILTSYGVPTMAANMFIFYFACISYITPPVAIASFAAAGLAGSNLWKTGVRGFMLGSTGFIIPFMLVFTPELILEGSALGIIKCILTASVGIVCLSAAMEGWLLHSMRWYERCICLAAALLLIDGGGITDIAGLILAVVILTRQILMHKKRTATRSKTS